MSRGDGYSHAAWEQFYQRHVGYLHFACARAFSTALGPHRVEDLVQDVLVRAYERAGTFVLDPNLPGDRRRKAVRAWLGTISRNLFNDLFRDQPSVTFVDDDILEAHPDEIKVGENESSEPDRTTLLDRAMQTLSDREQHVLRTTAFWYQPGARHQRLPNKVMTGLAAELKTSPANIRQIRVRSMAKVKDYFRRHSGI